MRAPLRAPRHYTYLAVSCILSGIAEGSRSEIVLLPRGRDAGAGCRSRCIAGMIMGLGEVGGLHGDVSGEEWTCSGNSGVEKRVNIHGHVTAATGVPLPHAIAENVDHRARILEPSTRRAGETPGCSLHSR
jgi:hypothetical protein